MSRFYSSSDAYLEVAEPKVDQKYHVKWAASPGMVWRCTAIDLSQGTVTLITPKTKRILKNIKISDLLHTRKMQYNLEKK